MPTVSGTPTITVYGKAIESRCDPPEQVTQAFNADGSPAGYFHSSPPLKSGSYGVRLDLANTLWNGSQVITTPAGFLLSLYGATPPGALIRGNQTAWYWSAAGSVWPNIGYSTSYIYAGGHYNPVTAELSDSPLYQDLGGGVTGGYTGETEYNPTGVAGSGIGGVSVNDWLNQSALPCTTLTQSQTLPANPGQYVYYVTATDLYPVIIFDNISFYSFDSGTVHGYQTQFIDRIYVAGGDEEFGSSESYILDARKNLAANLIITYPRPGTLPAFRGPNPYFAWDGKLVAFTSKISADILNGPASPYVDDPVFNLSGGSTDSIQPYAHNGRTEYRHQALPYSSGVPPVPANINDSSVGDGTFKLHTKIQANVTFTAVVGGSYVTQYLPGALVVVRVVFVASTLASAPYILVGNTTDSGGMIAPAEADYWLGHIGPDLPEIVGLQFVITTPEYTYPNGVQVHTETFDSTVGLTADSHYQCTIGGPYQALAQPALVDGLWTCNQPPISGYSINVAQLRSFNPPIGAAQVVQDAHRRTEMVSVAPSAQTMTFSATHDAGHTFVGYALPPAKAFWPSLIVNHKTNSHRVVFGDTDHLFRIDAAGGAAMVGDWGAPVQIGSLNYRYPHCVQHPQQGQDYVLMSAVNRSNDTSVDILASHDGGTSWAVIAANVASIGTSSAGRPELCWMAGLLFLIVPGTASIRCYSSRDGGYTWSSPTTALTASHSALSPTACAQSGRLYVAAQIDGSNVISSSSNLGLTWSAPSALPAVLVLALGVEAWTGRLLLGTSHHSNDGGTTWSPN